jgi:hypothetical protein
MNMINDDDFINILIKMHGFMSDGRIALAREMLEDLLEDITGENYAPVDT